MKEGAANLVLVYHPNCRYSREIKPEWIKLAQQNLHDKKNLNILAVNDGFAPEIKKHLPGAIIHYYPTILLYKNDRVIEFNPGHRDPQFHFNLNGLNMFLTQNGL
jgi:thiol-disulfide isomerase/thioredoxin